MPREISCGYLCCACESPTSSRASAVLFCSAAFDSSNTRSTARWTFSKDVSHGSSEWFWKTTPRSGPGPSMCLPARRMVPSLGFSRPATRFRSVLLPQPECPMRVTNSLFAICRSMSASATKSPFFVSKVLPTDSTLRYLCIGEPLREQHQRVLEQQADDAEGEDGDDDVLDVEVVPLVRHPEADAHAAGQHLGGDDHEPGDADREAHAGDHVRQHRREQDFGEDFPFREVQHPSDVQVILRDLAHADCGVDDPRPQAADEDHA